MPRFSASSVRSLHSNTAPKAAAIAAETASLSIMGEAAARAVREKFEQGKAIEKLESFYAEARAFA